MKIRIFKSKTQRRLFLMRLFFLMILGSVFAFTVGTAFISRSTSNKIKTEEELIKKFSKQRIFNESLTEQEKNFLISRGITIATYYYNNSPEFFELDSFVDLLGGQLYIEKIKANETKLELNSIRSSVTLENLSKENIFKALCKVLYQPPPDCSTYSY